MKLKQFLLGATFASSVAIAGTLATAAHADISVFTGYADSLRPSGFFPGPWLGDAGVVSESAAIQPGNFDAGAIRIENTGGAAITVDNFTVTLNGGSTSFAFWGSLVIGAGENGIFTQTFAYNFDTSDFGGGIVGGIGPLDPGSNGIGGCSSTAAALGAVNKAFCDSVAPTVDFDIGADHFHFVDSGHILDTGHYDFVCCSPDLNESIAWNVIGAGASRGGVPEPATWGLMVVGFAGLGFALRRRHRVAFA